MADEIVAPSSTNPLGQNAILEALKDDEVGNAAEDSIEEVKLTEPEESDDEEVESKEEVEKTEDSEEETEELKLTDSTEDEDFEYKEVPRRKEILTKFPELFKTFPGIERAIYREDQYTKIFPSIKEAETAKERIETFGNIENDLFSGNIGNLLSAVKQQDPKAFGKISGTILQTLNAVDKEAYFSTVNHVIKHAINGAFSRAKGLGGEDGEQLQIAAQLLHKFFYGSTEVTAPEEVKTEEKSDPRLEEVKQKEKAIFERELKTAVNSVTTRTNTIVDNAIKKYIDPKGMMSDYVREKAINDVRSAVDKDISGDSRFKQHLDNLWRAAIKDNYSETSLDRVRKSVIEKAEKVLPSHIKFVRANAIKGLSGKPKQVTKRDEDDEPVTRRAAPPVKSSSSSSSRNDKPTRVGSVRDVMKFLE